MDILQMLKNDPSALLGALLTGGVAGLYLIGQKLWSDFRSNRKQSESDKGTSDLVAALRQERDDANKRAREEQERADRFAKENMELSLENGGLRADLRHANEIRAEQKQKLDRATAAVESLVLENRNKDRSITKLVAMNKQILRSINPSDNVQEGTKESENGFEG